MKKALALFLVIIIMGIGCLSYASISELSIKDKVEFKETVVYGDKSFIEGVTVNVNTHLNNQLFWNTTYVAGDKPKVDTEYNYSTIPLSTEEKNQGYFDMNISYGDITVDPAVAPFQAIYNEFEKEIEPGTQETKKFLISDYIEYYPISAYLNPPEDTGFLSSDMIVTTNNGVETVLRPLKGLQDYFKIPVLPDSKLEITLEKDTSGFISHIGTAIPPSDNKSDFYSMWTNSVYTHSAAYFTISTETEMGKRIDTSHIPGGYGIYRLPYHIDENNTTVVDDDKIEMVYPLNPDGYVYHILTDQEDENLLLFTVEYGASYLSVIDIETMVLKQKIQLAYDKNDSGISSPKVYDDYIVLTLYENYLEKICVITRNEDGVYTQEFSTPLIPEEIKDSYTFFWRNYTDYYAWNGKELIMCTILNDANSSIIETPGFSLAVYDASGIKYLGTYYSSLTSAGGPGNSKYHVQQINTNPLQVAWPKSS